MTTSGSGLASCSMTHGNSPSPTSRFDPPPINRWGTPLASSRLSKSGMPSCFLMRRRSVVPPIPSEVRLESAELLRNSTPSSGNAAITLGFSMRMGCRMLRSEQDHKLVAGAADVARANGEDGVAGARLMQQMLNAFVHRAKIENILVTGFANRVGEGFAGHPGDGLLAGGVDVGKNQNVSQIEGAAEVFPKVLRSRITMRLEQYQRAVELAGARGFQRSANFDRVMAVVVDDRDPVDDAFHVKPPADAGEFRQTLANQFRGHI